jgi:hypothetical protein
MLTEQPNGITKISPELIFALVNWVEPFQNGYGDEPQVAGQDVAVQTADLAVKLKINTIKKYSFLKFIN